MWWNKKDTEEIVNVATEVMEKANKIELEKEEKWVWVEGYKGTDENMQGYNNFQFELNKEYEADGEIKLCNNGYHFSLNLSDVNYYFRWDKPSRYFKVKALVRGHDYVNYGRFDCSLGHIQQTNKLVAKKIILLEEITFSEVVTKWIREYACPYIETVEDFKRARSIGHERFEREYFMNSLSDKYSTAFKTILVDKIFQRRRDHGCYIPDIINEANAYMEEGLSKDVAVYLLMKDL